MIEKAGREALPCVSLAPMTMFENVPTFVLAGEPVSTPVEELKLAHDGLFLMENVSFAPPGADALGLK